jgi:hypothetical protein
LPPTDPHDRFDVAEVPLVRRGVEDMDRDVGAVPAAGGRQPGMSRGAILASIGKLTRQSRRSNSSPRTSASAPRGIAYSCSLKRTPSACGNQKNSKCSLSAASLSSLLMTKIISSATDSSANAVMQAL